MRKLTLLVLFFATALYGQSSSFYMSQNYDSGLVHWFKICGDTTASSGCAASSSTTVFNSGPGGNAGTWSGTQSGTTNWYSAGQVGPFSGNFNGSNDVITVATGSNLAPGTGSWSWGAWAKTSSSSDMYLNCNVTTATNAFDWCIEKFSDNFFRVIFSDGVGTGGRGVNLAYTGATINNGAWHHLFVVYDSSSKVLTMYLDGAAVANSGSGLANYTGITTNTLFIGQREVFWNGQINDFRVYNRAVSAGEIAQMALAHN